MINDGIEITQDGRKFLSFNANFSDGRIKNSISK